MDVEHCAGNRWSFPMDVEHCAGTRWSLLRNVEPGSGGAALAVVSLQGAGLLIVIGVSKGGWEIIGRVGMPTQFEEIFTTADGLQPIGEVVLGRRIHGDHLRITVAHHFREQLPLLRS